MQQTKVTLIYWGLCLFIFLAFIPWIFNPTLALLFNSGLSNIWGDCNCFFGRHYLGLGRGVCIIKKPLECNWFLSFRPRSCVNFFDKSIIKPYLVTLSLQVFLNFEKKNSSFFQANIKYANARTLITNLVTICCITSLAFLYNPYT